MPTGVITGNLTATYFADSNDTIVLTAGASLITAGQFGITTRTGNENHIALVINGTVGTTSPYVPPFATDVAIFLNSNPVGGVRPVTDNYIRVGETGHVFSNGGIGIFGVGAGTKVLNYGLVEGAGAIEVTGPNNLVQNFGTINFGVTGIGGGSNGSDYTTIQNFGTLRFDTDFAPAGRNSIAMLSQGSHVRIFNGGLIDTSGGLLNGGILAMGDFASIKNAGTIHSSIAAITASGSNATVINTVIITVSSTFGEAVAMTGGVNCVFINSGTITSAGAGIAGALSRIVNSGDIIADGTGIIQSATIDFTLSNTGRIVAGNYGITTYNEDHFTRIINSGTIISSLNSTLPGAAIQAYGGEVRIMNSGTLFGDVDVYANTFAMLNSGRINGDVKFSGAISTYTATATGVVTGDIIAMGGPSRLQGGDSIDRLFGGESNDQIFGGGGNDLLNGGFARDVLTGGTGADVFVFSTAEDITTAFYGSDRITDFQSGIDHIDLSAFMAGGRFIGGALFTGHADEVRYNAATGQLVGDINGDRVFDWSMALTNKAALTAADFIF